MTKARWTRGPMTEHRWLTKGMMWCEGRSTFVYRPFIRKTIFPRSPRPQNRDHTEIWLPVGAYDFGVTVAMLLSSMFQISVLTRGIHPLKIFKTADVQGGTWRVHFDDESLRIMADFCMVSILCLVWSLFCAWYIYKWSIIFYFQPNFRFAR
jgi:hypothetical protein